MDKSTPRISWKKKTEVNRCNDERVSQAVAFLEEKLSDFELSHVVDALVFRGHVMIKTAKMVLDDYEKAVTK